MVVVGGMRVKGGLGCGCCWWVEGVVGMSVALESEEGLESWTGVFCFFLLLLVVVWGEGWGFGGAAMEEEEEVSLVEEGEEDDEDEMEMAFLRGERAVSFDPVTAAAAAGAGGLASDSLLEVAEDEDEESAAVLVSFASLLVGAGFGMVGGFASVVLAFLGFGSSSSLLEDAELEDALADFFRFKLLLSSCVVDFREDAPRPAVSFSSSASLSELEVDIEDALDFLDFFASTALGGIDTSFMLTSESLSLLLSSLLSPASSALLPLLPLLLVCSASRLAASFAFRSLLVFFLFLVARLSSLSLLLVSSIFCFSS